MRAYFLAMTSPSPRPSPAGRGRIGSSVLANMRLASALRLPNFKQLVNGCPLSQRERARVRESVANGKMTLELFEIIRP